ncbi:FMN-binding protein [Natronincola peptidivorans]|nr:FMN-binding protein [Natronincola peptidivorans]
MKNKKLIIIFIFGLLVGAGIYFGKEYIRLQEYRNTIRAIEIEGIELSKVVDGVYEGFSDGLLVSAKVWVTVENHRITDIQLEHHHDRGIAAEVLVDKVLENQSTKVDIVTGATSSSKVILKAIENALAGEAE